MDLSQIFNFILSGGLATALGAIAKLVADVRRSRAETAKAQAQAESVRLDNTEHATRILMDNIVQPLKDEFNETKKELARNTREMARLRKAIDGANSCDYRSACPVLDRLREHPKGEPFADAGSRGAQPDGQPEERNPPGADTDGAALGGENPDPG